MESSLDATSFKSIPAEEPELELYTIPTSCGWFSWDEIHETEKKALKEFFDGSSISRTPRIYKEYRDFIINKYREEPSRRLTFTEIRKSLVGDVSLLLKVFNFLEKLGLINFGAPWSDDRDMVVYGGGGGGLDKCKVRVEEGAPNGVRVVAMPNSLKPLSVSLGVDGNGEVGDDGFKLPLLASYSDVFGDLSKHRRLVCGNCGENCDGCAHYECTKENSTICVKCFKAGDYGKNKSADDFKYIENCVKKEAIWTEEEILLLLESVLKHGDDWELVAQSVPTKSKFDCISKLIQLPFGELMLGSAPSIGNSVGNNGSVSSVKQLPLTPSESQETIKIEDHNHDSKRKIDQNGDSDNQGPPLKKQCIPGSSLMKQVALISSVVGPRITTAAADAAVSAICEENQLTKEIFDSEEDSSADDMGTSAPNFEAERALQVVDSEMKGTSIVSDTPPEKNAIPLTLRMKATVATALGAAAARAKLLADQEEREMEHLVATIIETQLKKLQCQVKLLEDLEQIMEKEYSLIEELEESIIEERIDILQRAFKSGISRWRDHTSVKS